MSIHYRAQNTQMISASVNYTSFVYPNTQKISKELDSLTPKGLKKNPDYGILPLNAPCNNCVELIEKRTDYERQFVEGNEIYNQKGYSKINFKDKEGFYREINPRLYPIGNGVFKAFNQKCPTFVDTLENCVGLENENKKLSFGKNIKLYFEDNIGNKTLLNANPNWLNKTIGADGAYFTEVFPNIDFEARVMEGSIKTSYIIKSNLNLPANGWLVIADSLETNFNSSFSYSGNQNINGKYNCNFIISNNSTPEFHILQGIVVSSSRDNYTELYFKNNGNVFEQHISTNWLNNSNTGYPVSVDPVVTNSGTLAQASITGSGLNNAGSFVGYCSYNLTVARPANCTLNDVLWTFTYIAQNGAWRSEGAIKLTTGTCISPAAATFFWFCNVNSSGQCIGTNVSVGTDLLPCISPLAACSGNVPFTLRFYDRWAGASCSNVFIAANSPWTMTLRGSTLETLNETTTGNGSTTVNVVCFTTATLSPNTQNGVPGYTYLWAPGGQTTSTITYTANMIGTTTYTATVTDACGVVRTAIFTVNNNCVLPVTLKKFEAIYNGTTVDLFWETASELNSDYFLIEKSLDGIEFSTVAKVKAAGKSSISKTYKTQDTKPTIGAITYYRIKQFDLNREDVAYQHIIALNIQKDLFEMSLVPNPTDKQFNLVLNGLVKNENVQIIIFDYKGKIVTEKHIQPKEQSTKELFLLGDLKSGIYNVTVKRNHQLYHQKLIIN